MHIAAAVPVVEPEQAARAGRGEGGSSDAQRNRGLAVEGEHHRVAAGSVGNADSLRWASADYEDAVERPREMSRPEQLSGGAVLTQLVGGMAGVEISSTVGGKPVLDM